jgi:hypothetical protein
MTEDGSSYSTTGEEMDTLPTAPAYNHLEIVDIMTKIYRLMAKMRYIQESEIHYAPHDPPIDVELAISLGCETQVIEILQQLPYVTGDRSKSFFRWGGFADYRRRVQLERLLDPLYCSPTPGKDYEEEDGPYVRPWILPLNCIGSRGAVIFFDTRTGKPILILILEASILCKTFFALTKGLQNLIVQARCLMLS